MIVILRKNVQFATTKVGKKIHLKIVHAPTLFWVSKAPILKKDAPAMKKAILERGTVDSAKYHIHRTAA